MDEDEKWLPSPETLSGYVIVKNKKLKEGVDETQEDDDDFSDDDINDDVIKQIIETAADKDDDDDVNGGNDSVSNDDTISESGSLGMDGKKRGSKSGSGKFSDVKRPKRSSAKKKVSDGAHDRWLRWQMNVLIEWLLHSFLSNDYHITQSTYVYK